MGAGRKGNFHPAAHKKHILREYRNLYAQYNVRRYCAIAAGYGAIGTAAGVPQGKTDGPSIKLFAAIVP
jgi:hypothetical protein